jgi:uncharacterized protein YjiS (DUF1127 family)
MLRSTMRRPTRRAEDYESMTVETLAVARPLAVMSAVVRLLDALHRRYVGRRTLSALARLDPHLLRDIGLPDGAEPRAVRRMLRRP